MTDVGGATSTFTQVLSDDAVYEYRADRWWADGPRLAFVGCNPSLITWQAGARLDPTMVCCAPRRVTPVGPTPPCVTERVAPQSSMCSPPKSPATVNISSMPDT